MSIPAFTFARKSYYLLTKPGIIFGNLVTTAGGFAMASKGHFDIWLFLTALVGISFVIGSACVFNNCIDLELDKKMQRTAGRALVTGEISVVSALFFALALGLIGTMCLLLFTSQAATCAALIGFFVYVLLYSFSKYYSSLGTLIGSIAGALPPVVGYTSVSQHLDLGALILFAIVVLWQMPHFFAITIFRLEDYTKGGIPVLPVTKGIRATKIQMLWYMLAFIPVSLLPFFFGYVGPLYLIIALSLGMGWLGICAQGFKAVDEVIWAKQVFFFSLAVIMGIFLSIPFS